MSTYATMTKKGEKKRVQGAYRIVDHIQQGWKVQGKIHDELGRVADVAMERGVKLPKA